MHDYGTFQLHNQKRTRLNDLYVVLRHIQISDKKITVSAKYFQAKNLLHILSNR